MGKVLGKVSVRVANVIAANDDTAGVPVFKSCLCLAGVPAFGRDPFHVLWVVGLEDAGESGICMVRSVVGDGESHGSVKFFAGAGGVGGQVRGSNH
jgi:hypothetical protein